MIENCPYQDKCNKRDCDKDFCKRKYRLDCLFDNSLLPINLRVHKQLFADEDGTDVNEFLQLANIEKNIENLVSSGTNLFIHSTIPGNGKAQPDEALILTEHGYKKMADIKVNDCIYGEDGQLHKVIGKFDRGIKDTYEVVFNDRTSTVCCNEHLWNVRLKGKKEYKTVQLQELINSGVRDKFNNRKYFIPVTHTLQFDAKEVLIPPYLLGILLGNGALHDACSFSLNCLDEVDIINKINSELLDDYEVRKINITAKSGSFAYIISSKKCKFGLKHKNEQITNYYKDALRHYNLMNTTADIKFIPDIYLFNSEKIRLELLKGLMDTDGFVIKNTRTFSYSTASKKLADNLKFLVQSLGGTVTIGIKKPFYTNKFGEKAPGKLNYICTIKLPNSIIPFYKSRAINKVGKQQNEPYRSIDMIKYVGKQHCYCIMTDNPTHLYLTNDCIVTHNTSWSIRFLIAYFYKIWMKSNFKCQGLFISVPSYLLALKDNISKYNEYANFINSNVLEADIVVWDDIGTKIGTEFELSHLLNIINTRMNSGKCNIFTSNLSKKEMAVFLGERLASRICNSSIDIEFHGADKRYLGLIKTAIKEEK